MLKIPRITLVRTVLSFVIPNLTYTIEDDNHKPEMTIAVTPFDGLCGFRPLKEISHFLSAVPSLRSIVGDSAAKEFETSIRGKETSDSEKDIASNKKALQTIFSILMKTDKSVIASAAKDLVASAKKEGTTFAGEGGPSNTGKELADLIIRCNSQFEGDIGLFVSFFLNYVKLEIGEAMFLKADDIHAYLSGGTLFPPYLAPQLYTKYPSQILLNAWLRQTMSFVPASRQNFRIYQPSRPCSHIRTHLSRNRK